MKKVTVVIWDTISWETSHIMGIAEGEEKGKFI
jgi:hypothetical protein